MRPLAIVIASGAVLVGIAAFFTGPFERGESVRLTGVVAANEVIVSAQIGGRIQELHYDEGAWVKKGDLVAVLDREELEAQRDDQLARINQLTAKMSQDQDEVRLARDRTETLIEGAEAQLELARSQRAEAAAEMTQMQRDVERMNGLVKEGLVPAQRAEQTETSLRVAEAKIQSLDDQIRTAQAQLDLARANEQEVQVAMRDVEQTRAELEQARARLAQMETRLRYTEVRAPLSGMVSLRVARQGEVVNPGSPIITLVDLDEIWVKTDVEEGLVHRTWVGQPLKVQFASGEEVQGKVVFIAPEAEFATQRDVDREKRDIRTFGVKVTVPNPNRRLHPGMTAHVFLPTDSTAPVSAAAPDSAPEVNRKEESPQAPRAASGGESRAEEATEMVVSGEAPPEAATPEPRERAPEETPAPDEAPGRTGPEPSDPGDDTGKQGAETRSVAPDPYPETPESPQEEFPPETNEEEEYLKSLIKAVAPELEGMLEELPPDFEGAAPSKEDLEKIKEAYGGEERSARPENSTSAPEERIPKLILRATSVVDGKPVAVINYQRVAEGDVIAGARVIRISDGVVELQYRDRLITLRLSEQ